MVRRLTFVLVGCSVLALHATAANAQKPRQPTLTPGVRDICYSAYRIASRTPGASVRRRTGMFTDETLQAPVFGCGFTVSGSFKRAGSGGDAITRLRESFESRRWEEMSEYGADGPDGTSFAFRNAGISCFARGMWDGGADDEPQIPPADWYRGVVFCVSPAFPERQ